MSFLSKWKQTIKQLPAKTKKSAGVFFSRQKPLSSFSAPHAASAKGRKRPAEAFAPNERFSLKASPKGRPLPGYVRRCRFLRRTGLSLPPLCAQHGAFLRALFEKPTPKQTAPSSLGETVVYSKEELQKAQKAAYRAKKSGGVAISGTRSGLKAKRKQAAQPADDGSIFQPRTKRPNIVLSILVTIIRICVVLVLLWRRSRVLAAS
jgi:hypothetical protein